MIKLNILTHIEQREFSLLNRINTYFILLTILIVSGQLSLAQNSEINSFDGNAVVSLNGGISLSHTDYKSSATSFKLKPLFEYFFETNSLHAVGLNAYFSYEKIKGEDTRSQVSTQNGPKQIPGIFNTDVYELGAGFTYMPSIQNAVFPYLQIGISNSWFDPKDEDGNKLTDNLAESYSKSSITFNGELGLRFLVSENVSLNLAGGVHLFTSDFIDDIAVGTSDDYYSSFTAGFSYLFTGEGDLDGDGLIGDADLCPEEPEDYDGYKDEDGCPDPDNDNDGIADINDKCPNSPEDFDGFEDEDGCPDNDNDQDGIIDSRDECPNVAEDLDNFEDTDGCPEEDNDNDGILDVDDLCPNEAEIINGFQDEDGCPDDLVIESISKFILTANEIFVGGTDRISAAGFIKLNEIIEIIRKYPGSKWRIEGHMDSGASEVQVREMSFKRATKVRDYLVSNGLSRSQFDVYGLGDKFPIANNNTEEGKERNRRIEIIREK